MRSLYIITGLFFFVSSLSAGTIRVARSGPVVSLQEAIRRAKNGDTILVAKGIYREHNLVIDKRIILKGIDYPVLDGEDKYEVVSIKANGVVMEGFNVIHSGSSSIEDYAGIKIINCRDIVIRNNILRDNFFGIYSQFGVHCLIENNQVIAHGVSEQLSGNGIHCWKSDSMQIVHNTLSGQRDGIYFEFVGHSIVSQNLSTGNIRYGLHFMFSNDDLYVSNTFRNNGSGVAVMFSRNMIMRNNKFELNWGDAAYGLLLKEISGSSIENNAFSGNTSGIVLEGASRIRVFRNVFSNNGSAMRIQASCMDVEVTKNNFFSNTFDVSTNGSLVLNTFNENYWDKYEGYDLDRDGRGDVPWHPVSLYSMIMEKNPSAVILFRSLMSMLLDKAEKAVPGITPENLKDDHPLMKPLSS
jgi:nitrous oxidase accessory protein